MSRAQQGAVDKTAANQNTTYNTNAQSGDTAAQGDIGSYANAVGAFKAANPYGQGGVVQTAQNQEVSDAAAGGAQAAGNAVQSSAVRTGQNAGGAIAATQDMQEQNARALMGQEAANTAANAGANAGYQGQVVADTGQTAGMQGKLAAQESGAAQGALNTQEQAAQTPSFMDELGSGLIQAGANFAGGAGLGMCPAKGSLYLMADGTERKVEDLKVGDLIAGMDTVPQRVEEIRNSVSPILRTETEDGFVARTSVSHEFVLPMGGFVVAVDALGKRLVTAKGWSRVKNLRWDGDEVIYNVITDGSHTYRADGVWALGTGERRRRADDWNAIGARVPESEVIDGGR